MCTVVVACGRHIRPDYWRGRVAHTKRFLQQLKAILAGEIIKVLDREGLTVRAAQVRTGMAAADFSRIRKAGLGRFRVDRLMTVISRLGSRVDVTVKVRRPRAAA